MKDINQNVENHYFREGLFEKIIEGLREEGVESKNVKRSDLAAIDEIHVRGAEVSKELADSIDLKGASLLDVGCGLGGPCRMLAEEYNCRVTGIDLGREYIRTAKELSKLVKLDDKTTFVQGDAANLPFGDESFDVVWTQHVQMNIPDKKKLYSEIDRVLKTRGRFLYYDIFKNSDAEISYPMPWAGTSDLSFLFRVEEMHQILKDLGFKKEHSIDQTRLGIKFFDELNAKLKEFGPPKLGLNVLMGETTPLKLSNLTNHLKSGDLELKSGVYRK